MTTPKATNNIDVKGYDIPRLAGMARRDWSGGKQSIPSEANRFLQNMYKVKNLGQRFGNMNGRQIVVAFLVNAKAWRGDIARAVKKELRRQVEV
jgi:hypothetical protein